VQADQDAVRVRMENEVTRSKARRAAQAAVDAGLAPSRSSQAY
jgi:hypothetical protein